MGKQQKTPQQQEYIDYIEKKSPKSPIALDTFRAFWTGGLICCIGQALYECMVRFCNVPQDAALSFTSIIMVFLGATLTGIGIYDNIGKYAGAGSVVPITGFANGIVASAIEFKKEGYVMGIGSKMFTIAGPVLVYGISSSVLAGLIYYLIGIFGWR